ncbi:MAG: hypothetical protein AAFQ94_26330 [Bacteroidota bacterium]
MVSDTTTNKRKAIELMLARHVLSDLTYQNTKSLQLGILTIILSVPALLFDNPFAIMTFVQGLFVISFLILIIRWKLYNLLAVLIILFPALIAIELYYFGIPDPIINDEGGTFMNHKSAFFKMLNNLIPLVYVGYKFVVWSLLMYNWPFKRKYDKLPVELKNKIVPEK